MSMEKRIHRVKTSLGTCPTASFWNEANANLKRGDFQKVKKEKKKKEYMNRIWRKRCGQLYHRQLANAEGT